MSEITIKKNKWWYVVEGPHIEPWVCDRREDAEHYAGLHRRIAELEGDVQRLEAQRDHYRRELLAISLGIQEGSPDDAAFAALEGVVSEHG